MNKILEEVYSTRHRHTLSVAQTNSKPRKGDFYLLSLILNRIKVNKILL